MARMHNLANSHGQDLVEHSLAVGAVAQLAVKQLIEHDNSSEGVKKLRRAGIVANLCGLFHDTGKLDPCFQQFLKAKKTEIDDGVHIKGKKHSFEQYPRHNEVSWAMLALYANIQVEGLENIREDVLWGVYWSHTIPYRGGKNKADFETARAILKKVTPNFGDEQVLIEQLRSFCQDVQEHAQIEGLSIHVAEPDSDQEQIIMPPSYKEYYLADGYAKAFSSASFSEKYIRQEAQKEALRTLARSAFVYADKTVSALPADKLGEVVSQPEQGVGPASGKTLHNQHQQLHEAMNALENNERNQSQTQASSQIAGKLDRSDESPVIVFAGPAGCGKSKVSLEVAAKTQTGRIFYIAPRTAVAQSLFEELTNKNAPLSLQDGVEIFTSNQKEKWINQERVTDSVSYLDSPVVITTIDQMANLLLSHNHIEMLFDLLSSTVVVDEFHEIFDLTGLNLVLLEFLELKKLIKGNAARSAILMSATPNPYYTTLLGLPASSVVYTDSFNQSVYENTFTQKTDVPYQSDAIYIFNTATQAQLTSLRFYRQNKPSTCFHSKFTPGHRRAIFKHLFEQYGKLSTDTDRPPIVAGPIVQASLNISALTMYSEISTAENFMQRIGRLNRFSEGEHARLITIIDSNKKQFDVKVTSEIEQNRTKAWAKFILQKDLSRFTVKELYALYYEFHQTPEAIEAYRLDFCKAAQKSIDLFKSNVLSPKKLTLSVPSEDGVLRMAKLTLRDSSVFIYTAHFDFSQPELPAIDYVGLTDDDRISASKSDLESDAESYCANYLRMGEKLRTILQSNKLLGVYQRLADNKKAVNAIKKDKDLIGWLLRQARSSQDPILTHKINVSRSESDDISYFSADGLILGLMNKKHF